MLSLTYTKPKDLGYAQELWMSDVLIEDKGKLVAIACTSSNESPPRT